MMQNWVYILSCCLGEQRGEYESIKTSRIYSDLSENTNTHSFIPSADIYQRLGFVRYKDEQDRQGPSLLFPSLRLLQFCFPAEESMPGCPATPEAGSRQGFSQCIVPRSEVTVGRVLIWQYCPSGVKQMERLFVKFKLYCLNSWYYWHLGRGG